MRKYLYTIEVTDTFGGEANYSWVTRDKLIVKETDTNLAIVRRAKKIAEWAGIKCQKEDYGEYISLRPYGMCQIMFIIFEREISEKEIEEKGYENR